MQVIPASCPQCGTQYQLTPEHLAVANGKVRCGVCNTIFQAVPPTPAEPIVAGPTSKFVNNADEQLLNDTGIRQSFDKKTEFATGEFNSSLKDIGDDDLIQDDPKEHEHEHEDLFENSLSALDDDDDYAPAFGRKTDLAEETDEEEWASKLLDEEGLDVKEVLTREEVKKNTNNAPRQALGSSSDDFDFDLDGLDTSALSLSKDEQEAFGFGDEESTKDEMIRNIKPEPLVLQILNKTSLLSTIGLSISAIVAILVLGMQLFFFQKDTLARSPEWRGVYESTCNIIGCTLPAQYAIDDIKATNLTVKSHPHFRNALMVDAIIINHANLLQPFPNIELFFTDTEEHVVAARQFKPAEYLRGELASANLMPAEQSIHIALELNDPGENATGYFIKLSY